MKYKQYYSFQKLLNLINTPIILIQVAKKKHTEIQTKSCKHSQKQKPSKSCLK